MGSRLPPLNALKAFEAAARLLSFTRAAEEMNVTQAAISHQIKSLEEHLGLPLFRRLNRALMLTDEGQMLFPAVRDAFSGLAEATERLRVRDAGGPLTVSVLPSFAVKWLVPRMNHFLERHPDIDLRISANERFADFGREGIDVGIRFGAGRWSGLHTDFVASESVTPVCSPALAKGLKKPADLAGVLLLHEEMVPLRRFPDWAAWLKAAGESGIDVGRGPRFSHTHIMLQAAIDGQGVALGQMLLAADDLAAGRLVAPFALRLPVGYGYYLACLPSAANRAKIRAFRQWVLSEVGSGRDAGAAQAAAQPSRRSR